MLKFALLVVAAAAVAEASVKVTRSSRDGRHPTAMELEVQLPHGGKSVRIPLKRTDEFEKVPITVRSQGVSRTFSSRQVHDPSHAHYRDIESRSVVSVREVNGRKRFAGHFQHKGMSYLLEPHAEGHRVTPMPLLNHQMTKKAQKVLSRKRRQTNAQPTDYVIEVAVVIDHTVWNFFNEVNGTSALTEMHYYFTHIMNGVDVVFRNITTPSISIRTVSFTVSTDIGQDEWMPSSASARKDASKILGKLTAYKQTFSPQPDHVMAFTRENIHRRGKWSVAGVAYLRGVCGNRGVSINEDRGLQSWNVAAHELGHNMGANHDGGKKCPTPTTNIMAPTMVIHSTSNVNTSYTFSHCSIRHIQSYVDSLGDSNCLQNSMGSQVQQLAMHPGEGTRLTLGQVCKLSFPQSEGKLLFTRQTRNNPASICAKIFCQTSPNSGQTLAGLRAPAGTFCSSKKTCNWNGECADDENAPDLNGGCFWGDRNSAAWCSGWADKLRASEWQRQNNCGYAMSKCCRSCAAVCAGYV